MGQSKDGLALRETWSPLEGLEQRVMIRFTFQKDHLGCVENTLQDGTGRNLKLLSV